MTRVPKASPRQLKARIISQALTAVALAAFVSTAWCFEIFPVALNGGAYAKETNVDLEQLTFQSEADIAACGLSKRRYANNNYKPLHEAITRSAYKAVGRPIAREPWVSTKVAGAIWNDDPEYLARKAWH